MILFYILAFVAVAAALTVILHRNPVYSALALVVTLFQIAVMYVALEAYLVALLQVIVYAGAIVVLFLFVIMLLSLEPEEPRERRLGARTASLGAASLLGLELCGLALLYRPVERVAGPSDFGSTEVLAGRLFSTHLLPFELTSVLLLVAVVGAVVMARRRA